MVGCGLLRATSPRGDQRFARPGLPAPRELLQPPVHSGFEAQAEHIDAQLARGRHLVDILSPRPGRGQEPFLDRILRDRDLSHRNPPRGNARGTARWRRRSEEHTSELQSLMRISYAVFCLKKKKTDIMQ